MLRALELASPYQWDLAQRDLFVPGGGATTSPIIASVYGPQGVWPFVITGTHPYTGTLKQILNEHGGDGTIRVPAANLNTRGITIDFSRDELDPIRTEWVLRHASMVFPFAVLPDRDHGSIIDPSGGDIGSTPSARHRLGDLLLQALRCQDFATYNAIESKWAEISESTAALGQDAATRGGLFPHAPKSDSFHQYLQVVVRVEDEHGAEVDDYFLEFFGPDVAGSKEIVFFQQEVL
jgi:hypothetical protein